MWAGNIEILFDNLPITNKTTIGEMYELTQRYTPKMFDEALELISNSDVNLNTNDVEDCRPLRGYPRTEEDSQIFWEKDAEEINRIVKASSSPFNGAYTFHKSRILRIWESDVVIPNFDYLASPGQVVEIRRESGEVLVATGKNFLVMKVIEYENSGLVKPIEIIKSIRTRLGLNVELEILRILNIIQHNES